jgi:ribosomal protein L11 methyltransferase
VIRLALRVKRADAELVLADLLELAPGGVEEVDLSSHDGSSPHDATEGVIEYAVYGSPGELPELPDLQAAAGGALVGISTSEVSDDWPERWKQFHRPVLIESPAGSKAGGVPALHVRPPWESPSAHAGAREIVIDPAQAFGTGAHATTRLCLELLLELAAADDARGEALDVGTGSGVLAIAAAMIGYRPVLALDNDLESVLATTANALANGVDVETRRFDLRRDELPEIEGAPTLVLANLLGPLLHDLADTIASPPRHLIASGLLLSEAASVASAFAIRHGLSERRRLERGEWAALLLTRG